MSRRWVLPQPVDYVAFRLLSKVPFACNILIKLLRIQCKNKTLANLHLQVSKCRATTYCELLPYSLMTNKLLLAVIILMELAILGAVVYLKFFR